jgi:hypothetical protein
MSLSSSDDDSSLDLPSDPPPPKTRKVPAPKIAAPGKGDKLPKAKSKPQKSSGSHHVSKGKKPARKSKPAVEPEIVAAPPRRTRSKAPPKSETGGDTENGPKAPHKSQTGNDTENGPKVPQKSKTGSDTANGPKVPHKSQTGNDTENQPKASLRKSKTGNGENRPKEFDDEDSFSFSPGVDGELGRSPVIVSGPATVVEEEEEEEEEVIDPIVRPKPSQSDNVRFLGQLAPADFGKRPPKRARSGHRGEEEDDVILVPVQKNHPSGLPVVPEEEEEVTEISPEVGPASDDNQNIPPGRNADFAIGSEEEEEITEVSPHSPASGNNQNIPPAGNTDLGLVSEEEEEITEVSPHAPVEANDVDTPKEGDIPLLSASEPSLGRGSALEFRTESDDVIAIADPIRNSVAETKDADKGDLNMPIEPSKDPVPAKEENSASTEGEGVPPVPASVNSDEVIPDDSIPPKVEPSAKLDQDENVSDLVPGPVATISDGDSANAIPQPVSDDSAPPKPDIEASLPLSSLHEGDNADENNGASKSDLLPSEENSLSHESEEVPPESVVIASDVDTLSASNDLIPDDSAAQKLDIEPDQGENSSISSPSQVHDRENGTGSVVIEKLSDESTLSRSDVVPAKEDAPVQEADPENVNEGEVADGQVNPEREGES